MSGFWLCFLIEVMCIPWSLYLHIFALLWPFSVDPPFRMTQLVDYMQCPHAIGQTTFQSFTCSKHDNWQSQNLDILGTFKGKTVAYTRERGCKVNLCIDKLTSWMEMCRKHCTLNKAPERFWDLCWHFRQICCFTASRWYVLMKPCKARILFSFVEDRLFGVLWLHLIVND